MYSNPPKHNLNHNDDVCIQTYEEQRVLNFSSRVDICYSFLACKPDEEDYKHCLSRLIKALVSRGFRHVKTDKNTVMIASSDPRFSRRKEDYSGAVKPLENGTQAKLNTF